MEAHLADVIDCHDREIIGHQFAMSSRVCVSRRWVRFNFWGIGVLPKRLAGSTASFRTSPRVLFLVMQSTAHSQHANSQLVKHCVKYSARFSPQLAKPLPPKAS